MFASVAIVLLTFDFEFLGYVNQDGKPRKNFPSLKQAYSGTGVLQMEGDMKVRMKRKGNTVLQVQGDI